MHGENQVFCKIIVEENYIDGKKHGLKTTRDSCADGLLGEEKWNHGIPVYHKSYTQPKNVMISAMYWDSYGNIEKIERFSEEGSLIRRTLYKDGDFYSCEGDCD